MTAFTAIENMVRTYGDSDLKNDPDIQKMISDLNSLEEVDSGEERAEQRELLAQNIVNYLVINNYVSEEEGFNLLNLTNSDYGHPEIVDVDLIDSNDCDEDELTEKDDVDYDEDE